MIPLPLLLDAFPDYDVDGLPQIPPDWVDASWVNDSCPCFLVPGPSGKADYGVAVYVDYARPIDRESETESRFSVVMLSAVLSEGP